MSHRKQEREHTIGYLTIKTISDVFDGEVLDTQVKIGEETICCVAGCNVDEFIEKLNNLVDEYRI